MNRNMGFFRRIGCIGALVLSMIGNSSCATVSSAVVSPFVGTKKVIEAFTDSRKDFLTKDESFPLPAAQLYYYQFLIPYVTSMAGPIYIVAGASTGLSADLYFSRHGMYPKGYNIWGGNWKIYPFQSYDDNRSRDNVKIYEDLVSRTINNFRPAHHNAFSLMAGDTGKKVTGGASLSNGMFSMLWNQTNIDDEIDESKHYDSFNRIIENAAFSIPWNNGGLEGSLSGFFSQRFRKEKSSPLTNRSDLTNDDFLDDEWFTRVEHEIDHGYVAEIFGGRDRFIESHELTGSKSEKVGFIKKVENVGLGMTFIGSDSTLINKTAIKISHYDTETRFINNGKRQLPTYDRSFQYDADFSAGDAQLGYTYTPDYDNQSWRFGFWRPDIGMSIFHGHTGFGGGITYIFNPIDSQLVRNDWRESMAIRGFNLGNYMSETLNRGRDHSFLKRAHGTVFYIGVEGSPGDDNNRFVTRLWVPVSKHLRFGLKLSGDASGDGDGIEIASGIDTANGEIAKKKGFIGGLETVVKINDSRSITAGMNYGGIELLRDNYSLSKEFESINHEVQEFFIQYEHEW